MHKLRGNDGITGEHWCQRKDCEYFRPAIEWSRTPPPPKRPSTIANAVLGILNLDGIEDLKNNSPVLFHHSVGRQIRNSWELWSPASELHKDFNRIGIFHPDNMSGILFETAHRILNGKSVDLSGQVQHYKKYWTKCNCDMKGVPLDGSPLGKQVCMKCLESIENCTCKAERTTHSKGYYEKGRNE